MKDALEALEKLQALLGLPVTTWTIIACLFIYISHKRLLALIDAGFDAFGSTFGGALMYRRFDPRYRRIIRDYHLHLKLVGLRTEAERRPKITSAYVPIRLRDQGGALGKEWSVEHAVRDHQYIVILGDPGAGKSTLLDHLVVTYSERKFERPLQFLKSLLTPRARAIAALPVYVAVRRCLPTNPTLLDDVLDSRTGILPEAISQGMPRDFLNRCFRNGKALLLLDGLDEVASEATYKAVLEKVDDFVHLFPKNSVVITCRKAGWRGGLQKDFSPFTTLPLDFQQQEDFVQKWYASILRYVTHGEPADFDALERRAEREAQHLLALVRSKERLRELASNPLLLSLICLVHRQKKNLPRGRAALYAECVDVLLFHWDATDKDLEQIFPSTEQKKELLREVAYRLHGRGQKDIKRSELEKITRSVYSKYKYDESEELIVRQIEVRSGLMVERAIDALTFSHLTFQECFVVDYLLNNPSLDVCALDCSQQQWREPLLLLCGSQRNPNQLIESIYKVDEALALTAIAEADPSSVDLPKCQGFVEDFIARVQMGEITTATGIPPIVGLMSIEGNPFGQMVEQFVQWTLKQRDSRNIGEIVALLANTQTGPVAQYLISILQQPRYAESKQVVIAALARMGDPAVHEVVERTKKGDLKEDDVFAFLVECPSIGATQALWQMYRLDPPEQYELGWAMAMSRKITNRASDRWLREKFSPSEPVRDNHVWPYRWGDASVLAAMVSRCIEILSRHYVSPDKLSAILKNIDSFAKNSVRVQIPLLIAGTPKSDRPLDVKISEVDKRLRLVHSDSQDSEGKRESFYKRVLSELHLSDQAIAAQQFASIRGHNPVITALRYTFDEHLWASLRGFLSRRHTPFRKTVCKVAFALGITAEFVAILLVSVGCRALLPPDGTYSGFWFWIPSWMRWGVFLLAAFSIAGTLGSGARDVPLGISLFIVIAILFMVIPAAFFFGVIWDNGTSEVEKMISTRRIRWPSVLYAIAFCGAAALLGVVATREWITADFTAVFSVFFLAYVIGVFLQTRARAFQKNALATWLRNHPRGNEVLDEFQRSQSV